MIVKIDQEKELLKQRIRHDMKHRTKEDVLKASETLRKGYGACWNKNLLMIAMLRYYKIPSRLKANPMKNDFMRPAMGAAYLTVSSPFRHCFTEVYLDGRWIAIDPTLDKNTYNKFLSRKKQNHSSLALE